MTIPLSLVAALLVLYWRGTTINTMVLAGLVIAMGAVVDDAIVDVENIVRRSDPSQRERRPVDPTTAKIVFDASLEVRGAVVYASLIEALALLPIFFLQGLTGSFFRPLATAYALAVMVSMVVALIRTPAMASDPAAQARRSSAASSPVVRWLQKGYERALAADHPHAAPRIRRPSAP